MPKMDAKQAYCKLMAMDDRLGQLVGSDLFDHAEHVAQHVNAIKNAFNLPNVYSDKQIDRIYAVERYADGLLSLAS